MKKRAPGLKDVATLANVSIATVSHVLNQTRYVSPNTTNRVLRAVKELGYFRDDTARQLRMGHSGLLGVLIVDYNPFFMDVLQGIQKQVSKQGWKLIVASTGEDWSNQKELLQAMISRGVEGVLLAPAIGANAKELERLSSADIPIVCIDRKVSNSSVPTVTSTNFEGSQVAVDHLLHHGYRQIGLILGSTEISTMRDRLAGYRTAHDAKGLSINEDLIVTCNALSDGGFTAMEDLLTKQPQMDAVFVTNDLMVMGALRAIKSKRLRIPADIAVVSIDHQPWIDLVSPRLTVLKQEADKVGELAVQLLYSRKNQEPVAGMTIETNLQVGDSCGCNEANAGVFSLSEIGPQV